MLNNVFLVNFSVESEAYQALSELKRTPVTDDYVISQAAIIKRENGIISPKDGIDIGLETNDDRIKGGLIGSLTGVLGGPIGMLFYGTLGAIVGGAVDAKDYSENASVLENVARRIEEGQTALLIMASEKNAYSLASQLAKFDVTIDYYDAAEVEAEIEQAAELQKQMEKEARKKLRQEKTSEQKAKIAKRREEFKAKVEARREKYKKQSDKDGV